LPAGVHRTKERRSSIVHVGQSAKRMPIRTPRQSARSWAIWQIS
jgi:hypothetical protein